jgi:hypothetical protein
MMIFLNQDKPGLRLFNAETAQFWRQSAIGQPENKKILPE